MPQIFGGVFVPVEIDIDENVDEIYFYTGNKGYKLVLIKSEDTGEWVKLKYKKDSNELCLLN